MQKLVEKDLSEITKPPPKPKKARKKNENNENENIDIDADETVNNAESLASKLKTSVIVKKAGRSVNNLSKKFSYVYRLSYTCTMSLFKLIYRCVVFLFVRFCVYLYNCNLEDRLA